jgi:hypothetical protein
MRCAIANESAIIGKLRQSAWKLSPKAPALTVHLRLRLRLHRFHNRAAAGLAAYGIPTAAAGADNAEERGLMMKVKTNLKAGDALQDVTATASQTAGDVQTFFSNASNQAQGFTDAVVRKTKAVWNALLS